jgi:hypothetical protein
MHVSLTVSSPLVKALHQLSTLQDAYWDPAIVRENVDILGVIERCAVSGDRANAQCKEETGEDSIFVHAAKMMRDTAPNWRVNRQEDYMGDAVGSAVWSGSGAVDMSSMDFSDDFWLNGPFHA